MMVCGNWFYDPDVADREQAEECWSIPLNPSGNICFIDVQAEATCKWILQH